MLPKMSPIFRETDPLRWLICRRIMKCLYHDFMDSRLAFKDFAESRAWLTEYFGMNPFSFCPSSEQSPHFFGAYGMLKRNDGELRIVNNFVNLPCGGHTEFEHDHFADGELIYFYADAEDASANVHYVISEGFHDSITLLRDSFQVQLIQSVLASKYRDNIIRLLTDRNYLHSFTETLGRYASTLFPEKKTLFGVSCPVVDIFVFADDESQRIVDVLNLATALRMIRYDDTSEQPQFWLPEFHALLTCTFLLNGKSPLLEREPFAEAVIMHRLADWLEDILPVFSNADVERLVMFLLTDANANRDLLLEFALHFSLSEALLARICDELFRDEISPEQIRGLSQWQPGLEKTRLLLLRRLRERAAVGAPEACHAAAVSLILECEREDKEPFCIAEDLIMGNDPVEQLLGAFVVDMYARGRYTKHQELFENRCRCLLSSRKRVCESLIARVARADEPFYRHYAVVIFDMILAGYMEQEMLLREDVFTAALTALDTDDLRSCGWKILAALPVSAKTAAMGRRLASAKQRELALWHYRKTAEDTTVAAIHYAACAALGCWTEQELYAEHIRLCLTHFRKPTPRDDSEMSMLCLMVNSIRRFPSVRANEVQLSSGGILPEPYEHMPVEESTCKRLYAAAEALAADPTAVYPIENEAALLHLVHYVRMVYDCEVAPKYQNCKHEIAVRLLLQSRMDFHPKSSYALTYMLDLHCIYGTPASALAFYRTYKEVLDRKERKEDGPFPIAPWWLRSSDICGYIEGLFCLPRVARCALRASQTGNIATAIALVQAAADLLNSPICVARLSFGSGGALDDELRRLFPAQQAYIGSSSHKEEPWDLLTLDDIAFADTYWAFEKYAGIRFFAAKNAPLFYDDPGFLGTVISINPNAADTVLSLGYADDEAMVRRAVRRCGDALQYASPRLQANKELQRLAESAGKQ